MSIYQRLKKVDWFITGMVCFLLLVWPAFMLFMPWTTTITVAEVAERYPGQVDPSWRAVAVEHGRPFEWAWGTRDENPIGFATCAAALALGVGGTVYCIYRDWLSKRGGRAEQGAAVDKPRDKP